MENSEVFDRLVKELDPIERRDLLKKLEPEKSVIAEPMIDKEMEPEIDLEKEYYSLGMFRRMIIFFRVLIKGEDKFQITEEIILKSIERDIKRTSGNILSYQRGELLEDFLSEIKGLHESVTFFNSVLSSASGQARDEFLNFLGSLQIPIIHHQLIMDTDFYRAEKSTGFSNPADVRKDVMICVESNLAKITGELRRTMYMHSKTIHVMSELARYDFSEFENLFTEMDGKTGKSCYFGDARKRLERLTDILAAFKVSPDKQLLEALFLFHNNTLKAGDEEEITNKLTEFFESALKYIKKIRNFNNKVKLSKVMKLVTGDLDYKPKAISGGEDWFNLYSRYWQNLADIKYKKYSAEKRRQKLFQDMQMYF